ncbi:MAG: V4R domain-containing protein [Candidatus Micrarchaeia archaeon]
MAGRQKGRANHVHVRKSQARFKHSSAAKPKARKAKPMPKGMRKRSVHIGDKPFAEEPAYGGMNDIEEILASRIIDDKNIVNGGATIIPEILYNASPKLRNVAYRSGFSTGSIIYNRRGKDADTLLELLEKAGMGKVLYYPFEDRAIITTPQRKTQNMGKKIHAYEAGMIAGYLSSALRMPIDVEETHCVYNGNSFCQFVARPLPSVGQEEPIQYDSESVVPSLASAIYNGQESASESYCVLSMLPLAGSAAGEISKIFYMAGKEIARIGALSNSSAEAAIWKIASSIGVQAQLLRSGKRPSEIKIVYSPISSMAPIVKIYSSLFAGFVKGAFNASAKLSMRLSRDNRYVVSMLIGKGKSNK